MRDKCNANNKGYSLVETIIVIAIIGIVSAMALASVTMIHSAKAKDAAVVFDSKVAETAAKARGMNKDSSKLFSIRLYKEGSTYYIQTGTSEFSGGAYTFTADADNMHEGKGTSISRYVRISYYPEDKTDPDSSYTIGAWNDTKDVGTSGQVIIFAKSGVCISGAGTYCFYKRNGTLVAKDFVRRNGSHESR